MSLEIHGLDLRLAKKMLFTGVNLRIDKPNLVVYVIDEAGLFIEGADVNILSPGHNLNSVTDALGTALTRFMPAINNTLTVSKDGYATSTQIIYNETPSTLSVYVQLFASEIRLKVVNNQNEPIEGATCRVLNAIGGSNNVLSFDGVDDYVDSGNDASISSFTNNFTIEFWMYAIGNGGVIYRGTLTATAYNYLFQIESTNNVRVRLWSGGTGVNYTLNIPDLQNNWHHIAFSLDGARLRIYVDGQEKLSTARTVNINSGQITYIGQYPHGGARYFLGVLSDVRVWTRVLSELEINQLINKRLSGNEPNINAYWKLDDGEGTTATDSAGSNDGTIYGATWAEADESFPLFDYSIEGYDPTPYDSQTTNANGLTTLNYQINTIHGLEVTLPGKRRFIMPFERTTRGLLDWQVMLSDYLATFATDRGNILINSEPENNDANFLIE